MDIAIIVLLSVTTTLLILSAINNKIDRHIEKKQQERKFKRMKLQRSKDMLLAMVNDDIKQHDNLNISDAMQKAFAAGEEQS